MEFLTIMREWENEGLVRIDELNIYPIDFEEVENRLNEMFDYEVYDCDDYSSFYKVDGIVFRIIWFED